MMSDHVLQTRFYFNMLLGSQRYDKSGHHGMGMSFHAFPISFSCFQGGLHPLVSKKPVPRYILFGSRNWRQIPIPFHPSFAPRRFSEVETFEVNNHFLRTLWMIWYQFLSRWFTSIYCPCLITLYTSMFLSFWVGSLWCLKWINHREL